MAQIRRTQESKFLGGSKKKMKIEVKQDFYKTKVLINGLPHISIETKDYVGFNSWCDSDNDCSIGFITKTNKFVVEYDTKEKWIKILKALNQYL